MEGAGAGVETKFGSARTLVGAVAVVALVGENGAHLPAEIDGSGIRGKSGGKGGASDDEEPSEEAERMHVEIGCSSRGRANQNTDYFYEYSEEAEPGQGSPKGAGGFRSGYGPEVIELFALTHFGAAHGHGVDDGEEFFG